METILNWKETLKRMKLENIKAKSPGFFHASGGYEMKVRRYSDLTANELTRAIIDWITFSGGEATRKSVQGQVRRINGEMKYTKGNARLGGADIRGTFLGRSLSIEVKIGNDRMSENQERERERITRAGGLYFVARSFPEFLDWWNAQEFSLNRKAAILK